MRYAAFTLCLTAASAALNDAVSSVLNQNALVTKLVLPLEGPVAVTSGNGMNSLAETLNSAAQKVAIHVEGIVGITATFKTDVPPTGVNVTPSFQLAQYLASVSNVFWQTATDLEKKICAIASSITEQNINAQKQNLIVGINAQVEAIVKLKATLDATIQAIVALAVSFTNEERAVLTAFIAALQQSVTASIVPVMRLSSGLQNAGVSGLASVVASLAASGNALVQTAAKVQLVSS